MFAFPYMLMDEIEHLRQVLDYMPCNTCEEIVNESERNYMCTICERLNRIVSAEKAIPKWKIEDGNIIAIKGMTVEDLKPTITFVEQKKELKEPDRIKIEVLEIGELINPNETLVEEELPEWESISEKPYCHGDYTLYTKVAVLRGGRKQRIYFFSKKDQDNAIATPLPKGFRVRVNKKTGLPFLKKK